MNAMLEKHIIELVHQLDEQELQHIVEIMQSMQRHKQSKQEKAEILDLSKINISAFSNIQNPVEWQRKMRDSW